MKEAVKGIEIEKILSEIINGQKMKNETSDELLGNDSEHFSIDDFRMLPQEAVAFLDKFVIKQDNAKWVLASHLVGHVNRIRFELNQGFNPMNCEVGVKPNIMLIGPTGVGKTYMIKLIARKIGAPFAKYDATKFSETGYVGENVDSMVRGLFQKAMEIVQTLPKFKDLSYDKQVDEAVRVAQFGIIYVDEIDKIAAPKNVIGIDVSRGGVQRNLLSLTEDREVPLYDMHDLGTVNKIRAFADANKGKLLEQKYLSTKNIIFVFSGVFSGVDKIISKRTQEKTIGFGAKVDILDAKSIMDLLKAEDLVDFGFESELVGRIPVRVILDQLNEEDLYQILTLENSAIVNSFLRTMESYRISVEVCDDVLRLIANIAYNEKTGARGLVSAFNQLFEIFLGRLPGTGISSLKITKELIELPREGKIALFNELKEGIRNATNLISYSESLDQYLDEIYKRFRLKLSLDDDARDLIIAQSNEKNISQYLSIKEKLETECFYFERLVLHGLTRINFVGEDIFSIKECIAKNIIENIRDMKYESGKGLTQAKEAVKTRYGLDIIFSKEAIGEIYFEAIYQNLSPFDLFMQKIKDIESGLEMYKNKKGDKLSVETEFLANPVTYLTKKIAGK